MGRAAEGEALNITNTKNNKSEDPLGLMEPDGSYTISKMFQCFRNCLSLMIADVVVESQTNSTRNHTNPFWDHLKNKRSENIG